MPDLAVVICLAFDHRAPFAALKKFKECICACRSVEAVMETTGTFDMIVHARLPSLTEYTEQIDRIGPQLAAFVSRLESNFVARRVERNGVSHALWVPCKEGKRRIDTGMINKIVAEGDYMRLCMNDGECLVHDTIRHLLAQLDREQFIQLHRSAIVRVDYIDRLMHREHRWVARLRDGTEQAVAKSRVGAILRTLSIDSSIGGGDSTMANKSVEATGIVNEMQMKLRP